MKRQQTIFAAVGLLLMALLFHKLEIKTAKNACFRMFFALRPKNKNIRWLFLSNKDGILDECCSFLYTGKNRKETLSAPS